MSATLACFSSVKRADDGERPAPVAPFVLSMFVGDRSGSMCTMGTVPQEGVGDFMAKHRDLAKGNPRTRVQITIYAFDDYATRCYHGSARRITERDIANVKRHMEPDGTTRLIDTAVEAIAEQQNHVDAIRREISCSRELSRLNPTIAVSFTLLTDGDDNVSTQYTPTDLNAKIKEHQADYGATCMFAAANQDAMITGELLGFARDNSLQIGDNVENARAAFNSCNAATIRSASQQCSGYTQAEREASCGLDDDYVQDDYVLDVYDENHETDSEYFNHLHNTGVAQRC